MSKETVNLREQTQGAEHDLSLKPFGFIIIGVVLLAISLCLGTITERRPIGGGYVNIHPYVDEGLLAVTIAAIMFAVAVIMTGHYSGEKRQQTE